MEMTITLIRGRPSQYQLVPVAMGLPKENNSRI